MENLTFIIYYPLSINIRDGSYSYCVKDGKFYPCRIAYLSEKCKCIDVLSKEEFDIVDDKGLLIEKSFYISLEKTEIYHKIKEETRISEKPVFVIQSITNTIDNLKFIEKYIMLNGKISENEINEFCNYLNPQYVKRQFAEYLQKLIYFNKNITFGFITYGFKYLKRSEHSKKYLKQIIIDNEKAVREFYYIQSGQKEIDELNKKNEIISKILKKVHKNQTK